MSLSCHKIRFQKIVKHLMLKLEKKVEAINIIWEDLLEISIGNSKNEKGKF